MSGGIDVKVTDFEGRKSGSDRTWVDAFTAALKEEVEPLYKDKIRRGEMKDFRV